VRAAAVAKARAEFESRRECSAITAMDIAEPRDVKATPIRVYEEPEKRAPRIRRIEAGQKLRR